MQEYRPGTGNRRRRRRGSHHRHGAAEGHSKKKSNPLQALVAGIANLFGKKKKSVPSRPEAAGGDRGRGPRRDRRDRRDRGERGERGERDSQAHRSIREAAEGPLEEGGVFKTAAATAEPSEAPSIPREQTEVTTPRLYVGNLSYDSSESDLFDLFSQVGGVRNVEIAMDKKTHKSKGFGFVEMDSVTGAEAAQKKFNGYQLMGRELLVMGAKSQRSGGDRDDRRGGRRGDRRR